LFERDIVITDTYFYDLKATLDQLSMDSIQKAIDLLHEARLSGRKIFIMGNGGSASTASHFVCDLGKNTRIQGWPNFKVIGLADNMAIFSALANDEGYGNVFSQQLANLVEAEDIVIGISASGKSPNVLNAIEVARQAGAHTIGMSGYDGGQLASMVDISVHVPSFCIEHVEDIHLILEHMITKALKEKVTTVLVQETGDLSC
jgi:D-sedoheptulose 7-phosphate isomerase